MRAGRLHTKGAGIKVLPSGPPNVLVLPPSPRALVPNLACATRSGRGSPPGLQDVDVAPAECLDRNSGCDETLPYVRGTDLGWIEDDLNGFSVRSMIAVGRVRDVAAPARTARSVIGYPPLGPSKPRSPWPPCRRGG